MPVTYNSDYWNIDDILAEEDMINCTFREDAKNLGYLESLDQKNSHAPLVQNGVTFGEKVVD